MEVMTDQPVDPHLFLQRDDVRLDPLAPAHRPGLQEAATDGALWDLWFTSVPRPEEQEVWFADAVAGRAQGTMEPFTVWQGERIVGSTRFYDIDRSVPRVAIGYTWYRASVQRTHVNTTAKLLLLAHAFEVVGAVTVEFHTDRFNQRSQRAIERLGAQRDGILRSHQLRRDGTVRDTVCYSILRTEWPDVRRHLEHRLATPRPAAPPAS